MDNLSTTQKLIIIYKLQRGDCIMMKKVVCLFMAFLLALSLCACGGSRSSSTRKWSDLSPIEKENARWAYEAQQAIKGK